MIKRHLNEQDSLEKTESKNEDTESPRQDDSEDDKITRYMRLVRMEVGRPLNDEEKKVIIKAMRATKDSRRGDERAPPWRKEKDKTEKATSPFDAKETERADERLQTLKKNLTNKTTKPESSGSSSSDEYTYEDDSEGAKEFLPAKEGTPITTTQQTQKERKNTNVPKPQRKSHTEERRHIPVIRTVKKEKSPVKDNEKFEVHYFPYDQDTKIYQFMFFEDYNQGRLQEKGKGMARI
jgi:hypothetical protein